MSDQDLQSMKTGEVAERARQAGVQNTEDMNKQEMIDAMRGGDDAQRDASQMQVHDPTSREKHKDYDQSDLKHVLGLRDWGSYDELIGWLKESGDDDNELTPGEVRHMIEDLDRLRGRTDTFEHDAGRLYQLLNE